MNKPEGRGVVNILRLADGAMRLLPREEARSFVDGLTDQEIAELALASAAAQLASGGTGNLIYESMAARLLKVDVATFTSRPGATSGQCTSEEWLHYCGPLDRHVKFSTVVQTCGCCGTIQHPTASPEH